MSDGKYVQVARLDELTETDGKCVQVGDLQIALFRLAGESACAIGNICPHQGAPLAEGLYDIDEGSVVCPLHAWEFDVRTGRRVNGIESVPAYETRVVGGVVEVLVDEEA